MMDFSNKKKVYVLYMCSLSDPLAIFVADAEKMRNLLQENDRLCKQNDALVQQKKEEDIIEFDSKQGIHYYYTSCIQVTINLVAL